MVRCAETDNIWYMAKITKEVVWLGGVVSMLFSVEKLV